MRYFGAILFMMIAGFWEAGAQISPLADQYLVNGFLTNPALAGTSRYAPLLLSARLDWLGMEGAPKYQTLTYHKTILDKRQRFNPRGFLNRGDNSFGKVGIGGGAFNLTTGAISQTGIHLNYAYHVYLDKGRLSFGLAPMYHQFIIDKSRLIPPGGSGDPVLEHTGKEVLHFVDVNAGIHYFSKNFFAGASVVQLFNSSVWFGDLSFTSTEDNWNNSWLNRNFYTYAGLSFELGKSILLEPSALLKYAEQKGIGIQANALVTINDNYQMGLFWRYRQAIGFFAGIRTGNLVFRYQFESPIGSKVPVQFVSNQVLVGYLME